MSAAPVSAPRPRATAGAAERVLALSTRAPRAALRLAQSALTRGAALPPTERARLLRAQGHALRAVGDYAAARRAYRAARRIHHRLRLPLEHAIGAIGLVDACMYLGRAREALAVADEARPVFVRHRDLRRLAMLETNVGNLHHHREALEQALAHYQRAARLLRRAGSESERASVDHNLANCLTHLGRRAEAEALYRDALKVFEATGQPVLAAQVRYGLACLRFLSGDYADAIAEIEAVRPELERLGARPLLALADLDLAEVLVAMRLHPEALVLARSAGRWFHTHGVAEDEARCTLLAGVALAQTGRTLEALRALAGAGRMFRRQRHATGAAAVALARAQLLVGVGRPRTAARIALESRAEFARAGYPLRALAAGVQACEALLAAGLPARAATLARTLLRTPRRPGDGFSRVRLLRATGAGAAAAGETAAALRAYRAALAEAARARQPLFVDEWRMGFLAGEPALLDEALGVLFERRPAPRPEEVWKWIAAARRHPRWRRRGAAHDGAGARQRIGALRAELEACYARLWRSGAEAAGVRRGATLAIERRALALEGRLRRLAAATAVPERAFEPGRSERGVQVTYFSAGGRLGALCRSGGQLTVHADLAPIEDVERLVRLLHYHMEVRGSRLARLDRHRETMRARMAEHLQALADRVLVPVLPAEWEGPVRVTAWGPLHRVPFHALPWRGAPLVEHAEVVLEPGRGGAPLAAGRHGALVVAHAAWETDAIEDEARSVAARLEAGGVEVERAVGPDATRARLGARAADAALIHLAGHAVYRAEHPEFSALKLADGWISARDLAALPLAGACVVLSACESGPRGAVAGDEMLGLARGLRRAGASAVVASLWRVDDRATRAFMDELYRSWAACGRLGAALCDVQRRAAARGADVYLWAPFCLMGEPDVGWPKALQSAPGRRYA